MTVPHISAPGWALHRGTVRAPQAGALIDSFASGVAARARRVAWFDVVVQLVVAGVLIALLWALATSGLFQRAVTGFSDWYAADVVPVYSVGGGAVLASTAFDGGVFGMVPEPPANLATAPLSSETVVAAG